MEGVILDFNLGNRNGVVRCNEGNRYSFTLDEWKSSDLPKLGERVDFVRNEEHAKTLYRIQGEPVTQLGTPTFGSTAAQQAPSTSALAVISLIAGILGLFIFGSLIAVICGHIARGNIRASGGTQTGDGMAITGLVLGYIGLALGLIAAIFIFAFK